MATPLIEARRKRQRARQLETEALRTIKSEVLRRHGEGESAAALAREGGIAEVTIYRWLEERT